MSLVKQLWIGISLLLMIALGGSFLISTITAQDYLKQQLQLKNIDTATSMALSISQMEKDPVTIELLVAAQFDSGHYERIQLIDPDGEPIEEHYYAGPTGNGIPTWFSNLLSLEVRPGVAQVQDGWQQFGTLYIQSHTHFAESALWNSTRQLLQWLLTAALLCGFIGTTVLKFITRPLENVINQAESIGQRHFVTHEEPRTWEFRKLVQAMNKLSSSVKVMLDKKTRELEIVREKSQQDPLTKLPNREHFLNIFESSLNREDSQSDGALCIIRLLDLTNINKTMGHQITDEILQAISVSVKKYASTNNENYAGRLNGTDFVLVSFSHQAIKSIATNLSIEISKKLEKYSHNGSPLAVPIAAGYFKPGEQKSKILSRLDGALALAEQKGNYAVISLDETMPEPNQQNTDDWRRAINLALNLKEIKLGNFPVRLMDGSLLHSELPVRMKMNNEWQPAGYFIGWAVRLQMLKDIDLEVLNLALEKINNFTKPFAINMSEEALCSAEFRDKAISLLQQYPEQAPYLWVEFPESCAVRHLSQFRQFCETLRSFGCKVGLEHAGLEFTQIQQLHDIGLHYLKLDHAIIHGLVKSTNNHEFVKSLCSIGHSLGILMIAEGVLTATEKSTLNNLGLDGVTGPGIE